MRTKIPSDWPDSAWTFAPKGTYANWTSYPTYAYQQFYRMNPRLEETDKRKRKKSKARRNSSTPPSQAPVRVIVTASETDIPQSSFEAKRVPWKYATNAGPFLPAMFPYGQGGRPEVYALTNPAPLRFRVQLGGGQLVGNYATLKEALDAWHRAESELEDQGIDEYAKILRRTGPGRDGFIELDRTMVYDSFAVANPRQAYRGSGRRGGFVGTERSSLPNWYFLVPSTRSWPAGDPRKDARDDMHAMEVIRYMNRGFGNRSQYPSLIQALADRYPVDERENQRIWSFYETSYDGIASKARGDMPTVSELR
jgi:hypothetical protein